VSSAEDFAVAGVVSLSMLHPWLAAGAAALLLGTGLLVVALLWQRIRRFRRARRRRAAQAAQP
jgi:hypothetical protein